MSITDKEMFGDISEDAIQEAYDFLEKCFTEIDKLGYVTVGTALHMSNGIKEIESHEVQRAATLISYGMFIESFKNENHMLYNRIGELEEEYGISNEDDE